MSSEYRSGKKFTYTEYNKLPEAEKAKKEWNMIINTVNSILLIFNILNSSSRWTMIISYVLRLLFSFIFLKQNKKQETRNEKRVVYIVEASIVPTLIRQRVDTLYI